ncbi:hypothetical protein MNB_SV-6-518 [hydrothermal vent metagenome]|uniref:Peptidase S1 domain-containing protein n=1 Tax=hydrothermal vent metagenome TaxID=652676 RepID=A0A1W1CAU3_9ZZZZ
MQTILKVVISNIVIISSISAMTIEVDNSQDVSYDTKRKEATIVTQKVTRSRSDGKPVVVKRKTIKKIEPLPIPTISVPSSKRPKKRDRNHTKRGNSVTIIPLMGSVPMVGKLLFTNGGNPRVCTASLLDDTHILLTAAHCLYYNGRASKSIKFYPQSGGEVVGGHITISDKWVNKNLTEEERYRYDYGFVVLKRSPNISPYRLPNSQIPRSSQVVAYGYQNGGQYLRQAKSIYIYNPALKMLRMNSGLLEGASGGPWVGSGSHTLGINSFYIKEQPGKMYSPYFGEEFRKLYKEASQKSSSANSSHSSICPF